MAMASMVHPARSVTSLIFLSCLPLACGQRQDALPGYDAATTPVRMVNGQAMLEGKPFSGRLYRLAGNTKDTLYCKDYRQGRAEGRHIAWYNNGQVQLQRFYRQGRKEGIHEAYWPSGRQRFRYTYNADRYEGVQYEWHDNGQVAGIRHYHEGQEEGLQQVFSPSGKRISNYEAKNGRNYGNIGTKHCTPGTVAADR